MKAKWNRSFLDNRNMESDLSAYVEKLLREWNDHEEPVDNCNDGARPLPAQRRREPKR